MCSAAIPFRKRSFWKYFKSEAMYFAFHRVQQRLLAAPTIELQVALQKATVEWLERSDETQAASWYERFWTG